MEKQKIGGDGIWKPMPDNNGDFKNDDIFYARIDGSKLLFISVTINGDKFVKLNGNFTDTGSIYTKK